MPCLVLAHVAGEGGGARNSLLGPRITDTVICRRCGNILLNGGPCPYRAHHLEHLVSARSAFDCDLCGETKFTEMKRGREGEVEEEQEEGWHICGPECLRMRGQPFQCGEKFYPLHEKAWKYACVNCGVPIAQSRQRLILLTGMCGKCEAEKSEKERGSKK